MNGNIWIGYGRLTKDPELRTLDNGLVTVSFTVAINRPKAKDKDHPESDFIDCVAWRETAEFICNYFKKGMRIAITGRLQTRKWEDKEGNPRKSTEIVVTNASFLDTKATNEAIASSTGATAPSSNYEEPDEVSEDDDDDDLPF